MQIDVTNKDGLREVFSSFLPDLVVHLAGELELTISRISRKIY